MGSRRQNHWLAYVAYLVNFLPCFTDLMIRIIPYTYGASNEPECSNCLVCSLFLPHSAIYSWLNVGCALPNSGSCLSVLLHIYSIINSGSWIFSSPVKYIKSLLSKMHENDTRVFSNGQIHLQNFACSIRENRHQNCFLLSRKKKIWKICSKMLHLCVSSPLILGDWPCDYVPPLGTGVRKHTSCGSVWLVEEKPCSS